MINIPGAANLLQSLPALRESGKYDIKNNIPAILQEIVANRTKQQAIKSNENISREEMAMRAQMNDAQLAMEGQRLQAGQQESELDRQNALNISELERSNRLELQNLENAGRIKQTMIEELGYEAVGDLPEPMMKALGSSFKPEASLKDISPEKFKQVLLDSPVPKDFNPTQSINSDYDDYLNGELPYEEFYKKWSGKAGKYYQRKIAAASDFEQIKRTNPAVDPKMIAKIRGQLRDKIPTTRILEEGATPEQLDLALNLEKYDKSGLAPALELKEQALKGTLDPAQFPEFVTETDRLVNAGEFVEPEIIAKRDSIAKELITQKAEKIKEVEIASESDKFDKSVDDLFTSVGEAKRIDGKSKRYYSEVYEPARKKIQDKLFSTSGTLGKNISSQTNVDEIVKRFKVLNTFEQQFSGGKTVSIPDYQIRDYSDQYHKDIRAELKGIKQGSPQEAERQYQYILGLYK